MPADRPVEGGCPEDRLRHADLRQGLPNRPRARLPYGARRRQHGHQETHHDLEQVDPGGHAKARDVEVQEAGHVHAQRAAAHEADGQRHDESGGSQGKGLHEVDRRHLTTRAPHRLHHADLSGLGGQEGGEEVDHEDSAEQEGEEAEARHGQEEEPHDRRVRVRARGRNLPPPHGVAAAHQPLLHLRRDPAHVGRVQGVSRDEHLHLVEEHLFPQEAQGLRRHVGVDGVLHAGLRLPDVVDRAHDPQGLLGPAHGLDGDDVSDLRPGDL